jgi:uncharacterized protein
MDPVVHFELPAEDRERMAAFYTSAFGWQTELLGPEMGNDTVVRTTETEASGPTSPGRSTAASSRGRAIPRRTRHPS